MDQPDAKNFVCASSKSFFILQYELCPIFQLPLLASASGDILEVFLVKHGLVCTQLGRFSFSSKTFRPEDKRRAGTAATAGGGTAIGQTNVVSWY